MADDLTRPVQFFASKPGDGPVKGPGAPHPLPKRGDVRVSWRGGGGGGASLDPSSGRFAVPGDFVGHGPAVAIDGGGQAYYPLRPGEAITIKVGIGGCAAPPKRPRGDFLDSADIPGA